MKLEIKILTFTKEEQDQIKDFGLFINEICDKIGRSQCNSNCLFREFCSFQHDVDYNFLKMLKKEFGCKVNMEFED